MKPSLRILSLIALCVMLFGSAACERSASVAFTAEESEPNFERGRQLSRQGRNQEALAAFLKVISKRGDEAPESHLEAGLIYRQHIRDQLAAIYHFRKYIELMPNSRQAELVRQQIEASKREFARTLPAHPMEDQSIKLGYLDQLDRLQRENDQLKSEIAALRAGIPTNPTPRSYSQGAFEMPNTSRPAQDVQQPTAITTTEAGNEEPVTGGEESPFVRAPLLDNTATAATPAEQPLLIKPTLPSSTATVATSKPTAPATSKPTAPAAAQARKHTVGPGDTLSSISQRYYGTRTRVKDIQSANRDVLKGGDRLTLGMELRIP
jgi:LysM repeat protein